MAAQPTRDRATVLHRRPAARRGRRRAPRAVRGQVRGAHRPDARGRRLAPTRICGDPTRATQPIPGDRAGGRQRRPRGLTAPSWRTPRPPRPSRRYALARSRWCGCLSVSTGGEMHQDVGPDGESAAPGISRLRRVRDQPSRLGGHDWRSAAVRRPIPGSPSLHDGPRTGSRRVPGATLPARPRLQ